MKLRLAIALLLVGTSAGLAQETAATRPVTDEIGELKQRLAQLEAAQGEQARREEIIKVLKELHADADRRSNPEWLENLKFAGDLRLRYQNDCYNFEDRDRNRMRFRLRFGFVKTWPNEDLEVGFRLASGADNDPTSTNQTFGDFFGEKSIGIDRAYAMWTPKQVKGLMLEGGKMANPFVSTDLIWDSDVSPEGVFGSYKLTQLGNIEPFVGAGFFMIRDADTLANDNEYVNLAGYQVGNTWKFNKTTNWTIAGAYYDYHETQQPYGHFRAGGNDNETIGGQNFLATGFRTINILNKVKFEAFKLPFEVFGDYVHNCDDNDANPGFTDQADGFAAGVTVGKNKKKGDWSLRYKYAHIEANATPGQFNDADFGFSNRKGHAIGGAYNLTDYLQAGVTVYYTQPIAGPSVGNTTLITQADLVFQF